MDNKVGALAGIGSGAGTGSGSGTGSGCVSGTGTGTVHTVGDFSPPHTGEGEVGIKITNAANVTQAGIQENKESIVVYAPGYVSSNAPETTNRCPATVVQCMTHADDEPSQLPKSAQIVGPGDESCDTQYDMLYCLSP